MRKQDLIHLHSLFVEVGRHYDRGNELSIDLSEYESMSVSTSSIHRSKREHQEAVFALTDAITEPIRDELRTAESAGSPTGSTTRPL